MLSHDEVINSCLEKEKRWLCEKKQLEQRKLDVKYNNKLRNLEETASRVKAESISEGWPPCRNWADDAEIPIGFHYMEQRFEELVEQSLNYFIVFWNSMDDEDCFKQLLQKYKRNGLYFYETNINVKLKVKVTSSSHEHFDPDYDEIVDFHIMQECLPCFDVPLPAYFETDKKQEDQYVVSSCWKTQNRCFEGEMPGKKSLFIIPTITYFDRFMDSETHCNFNEHDVVYDHCYCCYTVTCKQPAIVISRRYSNKLEGYVLPQ